MTGEPPTTPGRLPSAGRIAFVTGLLLLVAIPSGIGYSIFARRELVQQLAADNVHVQSNRLKPEWIRSRIPESWADGVDPVVAMTAHIGNHFDDARMFRVQSFTQLRRFHLYDSNVTDAGLQCLVAFRDLRDLKLVRVRVSDAGLKPLESLSRLVQLSLQDTGVTDDGMQVVAGLPELKWLSLGGTRITGEGLQRLLPLAQLEHLDLRGTAITDEDLKLLTRFPRLQQLNVSDTRITIEGVRTLTSLSGLKQLTIPSALVDEDALTQIREILHECAVGAAPARPMPGWSN